MLSRAIAVANKATPGVLTAGAVLLTAQTLADALGTALFAPSGAADGFKSPISPIPVAIVMGCAVNSVLLARSPLAARLKPGFDMCSKTILRAGIVCIGAKLSVGHVLELGAWGVPVVGTCIVVGLTSIEWLGARLALPRHLSALVAAGTSICGVTAITAVAPVINASKRDIAFAVANVVLFGLIGMICYPYVAHEIFAEAPTQAGLFLGTAIHDTSQVMGAALTYHQLYDDELALKAAAVTKLTRNLFLAIVVPWMGWRFAAKTATSGSILQYVPAFVVGFVAMAALRSAGDWTIGEDDTVFGSIPKESWENNMKWIGSTVSATLLGLAMSGVGLSTDLRSLKGVGMRAMGLGMIGAGGVAMTGLTMSLLTLKLQELSS